MCIDVDMWNNLLVTCLINGRQDGWVTHWLCWAVSRLAWMTGVLADWKAEINWSLELGRGIRTEQGVWDAGVEKRKEQQETWCKGFEEDEKRKLSEVNKWVRKRMSRELSIVAIRSDYLPKPPLSRGVALVGLWGRVTTLMLTSDELAL